MVARLDALRVVKLWAVLDAFEQALTTEVSTLGIGLPAFRLVGELLRSPAGLRQTELAKRLRVKPPTVSVAVARLERMGVVTRVDDAEDPRAWRVRLARRAPLGDGTRLLQRVEKRLLGDWSPRELRALDGTLSQLQARLGAAS